MNNILLAQVRGSRPVNTISDSSSIDTAIQNNLNSVSAPNVSLSGVASGTMFTIFFVIIIFYLIMSGILWYHWRTYNLGEREVYITQVIYFVITGILLLIALFSIA